jgi:type IV secretory pathway TrbD component
MVPNMSGIDRSIRILAAVVAVVVAFAFGAWTALGIILFIVAAVLLLTSLVGFCPLYAVLGISTCARTATR